MKNKAERQQRKYRRRKTRKKKQEKDESDEEDSGTIDSKTMQKFQQLAKDAQSSGDPVLVENYLQHADHYARRLAELNGRYKDTPTIEKNDNQEDLKKANDNQADLKKTEDISQSSN